MPAYRFILPLMAACGLAHAAEDPIALAALTEKDWLGDLPVVLSVSRLAQPLDETPGAVTIIDRDMIRRSGARDIFDVLKLVPGFIIAHANGGFPFATYHGDFDQLNRRLQVYIDGRSIYSTVFVGNVSHGMSGIVMDDVERIEVLRGSNSAAYGSNAFLGVVNVITRNAADTRGGAVSFNRGSRGIKDSTARLGWGEDNAAFRLSMGQTKDTGFERIIDDKRYNQAHFRGDLRPTSQDEILVEAGHDKHHWGAGKLGNATDKPRTEEWFSSFLHGQWRHQIGQDEDITFTGNMTNESFRNNYPQVYTSDGDGRRISLEAQHRFRASPTTRIVWGSEYRHEAVRSMSLFKTGESLSNHFWRLFANAEWAPNDHWLVNAGGLHEYHSIVGGKIAPRLMVNHHLLRGHTVRIGTTKSYRMPTLFELRGNWTGIEVGAPGSTIVKASGGMRPERLAVDEIGYLGEFRELGLSVDVRGFREKMADRAAYNKPAGVAWNDVVNLHPTERRGLETQLKLKTSFGAQFLFNHTAIRTLSYSLNFDTTRLADRVAVPSHYSSFAWFQNLPHEVDLSVMYTYAGQMTWGAVKDMVPATHQLDWRLAKRFRMGATRGEVALMVQAADGGHVDTDKTFYYGRRGFVSLKLEY